VEKQLTSVLALLEKLNKQTAIVSTEEIVEQYENIGDYNKLKDELDNYLKELHDLDLHQTEEVNKTLSIEEDDTNNLLLDTHLLIQEYLWHVDEVSDFTKKMFREYEQRRGISSMDEFFITPFGKSIQPHLSKTNSKENGHYIYRVMEKVDNRMLEMEYIFLSEYKNYIEIADYSGEIKLVLNFDGTINIEETRRQVGRVIEIEDNVLRDTDWRPTND